MTLALRRAAVVTILALRTSAADAQCTPALQFVFTSDQHYGITRRSFRGGSNVDAHTVNAALVAQINRTPELTLPQDGGVCAGGSVGAVDFIVVGGDIANRADKGIQLAGESWRQFTADYVNGLDLRDRLGRRSALFVVPGNHDASNAVGWANAHPGARDPSSMIAIYNMMVRPTTSMTADRFKYDIDRVHTSRTIAGVHLIFLHIWPDSAERVWMERDLANIPPGVPVLLFTHDPPSPDPKHFQPAAGAGADTRFERLLSQPLKEDSTTSVPIIEQRELAAFLKIHPNIIAYFHGHQNFNEFSTWSGPDGDARLSVFRVDSPMKGKVSADDERALSFQLVSIDHDSMTVREVLWNAEPSDPAAQPRWGIARTVRIR